MKSLSQFMASLSEEEQEKLLANMSEAQIEHLLWDWDFWARPEQKEPAGDWQNWLILAGRSWGKELPLSCNLPTPTGWTSMGAVQVGDFLLDERGLPCRVVGKYYPKPKRIYKFTFTGGAEIVSNEEHQWVTWTHRDRKQYLRYTHATDYPENWPKFSGNLLDSHYNIVGHYGPEIRTTAQIIETFTHGSRGDLNHSIPHTNALILPYAELPIDPWLLGYWLGNGCSATSQVCAGGYNGGYDEEYVCERLDKLGLEHSCRRDKLRCESMINVCGLVTNLKSNNLYKNKHVPATYLRASLSQRLELLRGMMDSDGYASKSSVEFSSTNKSLADAVYELSTSLSERPVITHGTAKLYGKDCGDKWRVTWRPSLYNPFSLPRKATLVSDLGSQGLRCRGRMITDYTEIHDPVEMACVAVDSPNHMYLAGREMIPTHNTRTGAEWVRANVCGPTPLSKGKYKQIALVANTAADARDVMVGDGKAAGEGSGILQVCPPDFRPLYEPSKRRLTWPNGAIATTFNAQEPDAVRGQQFDAFWCDELCKWEYAQETWDQLQFCLRLGQEPRGIITTTPKPIDLLLEIMEDPHTFVTRGKTIDNAANVAASFIDEIYRKYGGSKLGLQELNAEIVDWSGDAFFKGPMFLDESGQALPMPQSLDYVFVTIDTAMKSGSENDCTGAVFFGRNMYAGTPLMILDYDYVQIDGSVLIQWLPSIIERGMELARQCGAREGFAGVYIEDKQSGTILLQQGHTKGYPVEAIPSALTNIAGGKDERAFGVSPHIFQGEVKICQPAYDKKLEVKEDYKNHLWTQITKYHIADKEESKRADDLFDCVCYGAAIALGTDDSL